MSLDNAWDKCQRCMHVIERCVCSKGVQWWVCEMHQYKSLVGEKCPECEALTHDPKPEQVSERGAGLKFDGGKGQWTLLMGGVPKALEGIVGVLGFGAKKYAAHSWKQVENNRVRYRDAMYRHLAAIERGELVDPESGLPHWDHVATNVLFLSELAKEPV
ncbi:endolysin [Pseudomonas phage vB_PpuP-Luke-3]